MAAGRASSRWRSVASASASCDAGEAATATVAGVRLGLPQFAVLAAVGLAILVTLRHPAWLRRVAVSKATVAAAMFAAGGVYYPVGAWDMNLAGISCRW